MTESNWAAPEGTGAPAYDEPAGNWGNGDNRSASPAPRERRSRSPEERGRPAPNNSANGTNPGNNLHVSGLSSRVEDSDLLDAFGKFGPIRKAQVMRDPHSRESRGFVFVTMEQIEDADAAVVALNATELLGRTINVEKARRGRARTPTPGQYHGPPKRDIHLNRPYQPRGGDDRREYRGGGGGNRYDDRYDGRGGYDRYDDRRGGGYDRYDDRRGGGYERDDRRYDDRRGYDDRRSYGYR